VAGPRTRLLLTPTAARTVLAVANGDHVGITDGGDGAVMRNGPARCGERGRGGLGDGMVVGVR